MPVGVDEKLRAEGQCRLCQRSNRKLTKHRLVPGRRPWRGRYVWQNVVPLCWPCHDAVERDEQARKILRKLLWPVEIAYAKGLMKNFNHDTGYWADNFDALYPPSARDHGISQVRASVI